MKSKRNLLIIFILPVILVVVLAVLVNYFSMQSLKQQIDTGNNKKVQDNDVMFEAARLNEQITQIHIMVENSLKEAVDGRISAARLFRIHENAVNSLAVIEERVKTLSQSRQVTETGTQDGQLLLDRFEKYLSFVIMTSDISSVEPDTALQFVDQAQVQFNDFAQISNHITALLAKRINKVNQNEKRLFNEIFSQVMLIGSGGMLIILLLSLFSVKSFSRKIMDIADGLNILSSSKGAPPPLPKIEDIHNFGTGEFRNMAGSIIDFRTNIIQRVEAENSLRSSELRTKLALTELQHQKFALDQHSIVLSMNSAGNISYVNSKFCEISGYTQPQLLGKKYQDLQSEIHPENFFQIILDKLSLGDTWHGEICNKGNEDKLFWVLATFVPFLDKPGKAVQYIAIQTDITLLKSRESLLRKLSQAVEQSSESVVITNLDGSIEYVNETFVHNTGYTRNEAIGQNSRFLHTDKTPPKTYQALENSLSCGQPWKGVFHCLRKDGGEFIEFTIISPIHQADGQITHYVAVSEDITEKSRNGDELTRHRHHLEDMVRSRTLQLAVALKSAEAANQTKSNFLANKSHEIRTLMNLILSTTFQMLRSTPNAEQTDRLSKINYAADNLLAIINDILDSSTIETGSVKLESTNFEPAVFLDHVKFLISDQAKAKDIVVKVEVDGLPKWLQGDTIRLRQALLSFASNAIKFTEQGTVTLRASLLETQGEYLFVRFEVKDTGKGISPDNIIKIFNAFEHADSTTPKKPGSTGLGLTITRKLAILMGGEANVESTEGKGSSFWFSARLKRGPEEKKSIVEASEVKSAEAELRKRSEGVHILLVDDSDNNRDETKKILIQVGLTVDSAINGLQAVEMSNRTDYHLILMNLQMPEMDGLEAARIIRNMPGRSTTPILAMAANDTKEASNVWLEAGMNDFAVKPAVPEKLYQVILKWLAVA